MQPERTYLMTFAPQHMGKLHSGPGHNGDEGLMKLNQPAANHEYRAPAHICTVCPSRLWTVCTSVTVNVAAGINLFHEAFCQFFSCEFINYGTSNSLQRLIWISV